MKRVRNFGVCVLCVAVLSCSESTVVRSYPPGSKLYVNDHFQGLTPVALTVPRSEFADTDFKVRFEHDGYAPTEAVLQKQVCGGRVAGGVFTLGIVFLFKRPTCFTSPQDFALAALPGQAAGSDASAGHQPSVAERLERIEKMRNQGVITNEEYEHYRREILKDL